MASELDESPEAFCDGCQHSCPLTKPRCHYGARQARDWRRALGQVVESAPKCDGCHCACSLDDPQCNHGDMLAARWRRGASITELDWDEGVYDEYE